MLRVARVRLFWLGHRENLFPGDLHVVDLARVLLHVGDQFVIGVPANHVPAIAQHDLRHPNHLLSSPHITPPPLLECWRHVVKGLGTVLRIYLTGRVLVEDNGKILLDERSLIGRQGRLAFAHLVGEHLRAVPRDELAEELWPGAVPPSWERSLSALISKLRALLAGASIPNAALKSSFGR